MARVASAFVLALSVLLSNCACTLVQAQADPNHNNEPNWGKLEDQARHMGWQQNNKPVIVALGDSQTMFGSNPDGWLSLLAQKYSFSADIRNRGVSMAHTRAGKYLAHAVANSVCRATPVLERPIEPIKFVTIMYGSNDAAPVNGNLTNRLIPVANFTNNLHTIINSFTDAGVNRILLITPPPLGMYPTSVTAPFAEAVIAVGQVRGFPVADFFTAIQQVPDWQTTALFSDRLHLSKLGNQVLFETVLQAVETHMPDVSPTVMVDEMLMRYNLLHNKAALPHSLLMAPLVPK